MSGIVEVSLWGTHVGSLGYAPGESRYATFEYEPFFMDSGIQISPVHAGYPPERFRFSSLSFKSFSGLPGFIADCLPDRYGTQLIDIYMAEKRMPSEQVTALDRLCYVSDRGMGALEFRPGEFFPLQRSAMDLKMLAELAELVQYRKDRMHEKLASAETRAAALSMIRIGSSAGGARAKALVALSPGGKILDGTVNHGSGYSYWLLKFDSDRNRDLDGNDPPGMPVVEYIYSLIAAKSGIEMPRTELISDGEAMHFLIERFDRKAEKHRLEKLHYVSWCGMGHADRDGANSYEQLVLLIRKMGLGQNAVTELFRRAVFNIIGRNQDDHSKNFGFLMDRSGRWRLSPAFDMTYSYDPAGKWTSSHQSWLNGKNDGFKQDDLLKFGSYCDLSEKKGREIITSVRDAFSAFPALAVEYGVRPELKKTIESSLRMNLK